MTKSNNNFIIWLLCLLSFIVPIQPLLQVSEAVSRLKSYRLVEGALLIAAIFTLVTRRDFRIIPKPLAIAFWIGLAGWVLCVAFSSYQEQSIDAGTLEFLVPYCVLYLFLSHVRDRKTALWMIGLFALGAVLESSVQAWFIVKANMAFAVARQRDDLFSLLPTAANLIFHKASIPTTLPDGVPYSYGNVDNYASLWSILVPLLAGLSFLRTVRLPATVALCATLYLGLFTYSRGAVLIALLSFVAILILNFRTSIVQKLPTLGAFALLVIIHLVSLTSLQYLFTGMTSFSLEIAKPSNPADQSPVVDKPPVPPPVAADNSGIDRANAMKKGIGIAKAHWLTGVGFGTYAIMETKFTAPHNMAIMRFAEGGLLSLVSFIILALYAPLRIIKTIRNGSSDPFTIAAYVSVSAFMLKAVVFGASFSVSSNIVWGFAVMMLLAVGSIASDVQHCDL